MPLGGPSTRQCLLARRFVERGMRFVELSYLAHNIGVGNGANPWNHHGEIKKGHVTMARLVGGSRSGWPAAACEGAPSCLCATDGFGYRAVGKLTTLYDLRATVLHQRGVDHENLTFHHGGRDMRLTDVHGHVMQTILS